MNTSILNMIAEKFGQSTNIREKFKNQAEFEAAVVSVAIIFAKKSLGLNIQQATDLIMGQGSFNEIYNGFVEAVKK